MKLSLFLSPTMVRRVMSLYFDAKANVRINDITGPVFELLRGVRQGCPASPSFFTVAQLVIPHHIRRYQTCALPPVIYGIR